MSTRIDSITTWPFASAPLARAPQPVAPTKYPNAPSTQAPPTEFAAPKAQRIDLIHGNPRPTPAPVAASGPSARGSTTAERLHHAVDALEENDLSAPEHVRRERALRDKAGTVFGQGVPPLQLDLDRAHDASDIDEEETSGEPRMRIKAMLPRQRRRQPPRLRRRTRRR